jgi:uncharacterized protein
MICKRGIRAILVFLVLSGFCAGQSAPSQTKVKIPMRDGVGLAANLFRPAGATKVPTILIRTPYNKGAGLGPGYRQFLNNGYAVVVQDVRGRYESEGVFNSHDQEGPDGDDTVNWIASQGWSDGQVGMVGGSYLGIVQWKLALRNNPHLKAIFPIVSGNDDYRDRFYSRGGAMKVGNRLSWMASNLKASWFVPDFSRYVRSLPLRLADVAATGQISKLYYQPVVEHPTYDEYWKARSVREHLEDMKIPVFSIGGWYDNFVDGDLESFSELRKAGKAAYAAIGPWPHNMSSPFEGVSFGADSSFPVSSFQLAWFDHWMKGGQQRKAFPGPRLRIFVMGKNKWRDENEWPLKRAESKAFYLSSKKGANGLTGDGILGTRIEPSGKEGFEFDPQNPVATHGGAVCCDPKIFPWGPMDQRQVEARRDVLVYSTEPLKKEVEVTGPIRLIINVSSTALDTDFTAKLVDVFPDGTARNLCDGMIRMRYRQSLSKPELMQAGKVYKLEIEVGVTSNVFGEGHRIRLEVSSSNFPRFDRNMNTGGSLVDETVGKVAKQTVYFGKEYPSRLILPIVPVPPTLTAKGVVP